MGMIDYTFIKSRRRTIGITVKPDGSVILRAPLTCTRKAAEAFLLSKQAWVERARQKMLERREAAGGSGDGRGSEAFTVKELDELRRQAKRVIPAMVAEQARKMGVSYGTVSIRAQKTRWGSCSSKGNLNFNCMLMLMPENVQRYVVVHELCHRKEMNHSAAFWREVERWQPGYKEDRRMLKALGRGVLERIQ